MSNDSGVVEERNFYHLLLAICSETSDRICRIYIQDIDLKPDIQLFDGLSVVPKHMILNEPE